MVVADFGRAVVSANRLVARPSFEGGCAVLARLWRREVEAVVEPPPLTASVPSPERPVETPQGDSLRGGRRGHVLSPHALPQSHIAL